jgi:hypothetical protein
MKRRAEHQLVDCKRSKAHGEVGAISIRVCGGCGRACSLFRTWIHMKLSNQSSLLLGLFTLAGIGAVALRQALMHVSATPIKI